MESPSSLSLWPAFLPLPAFDPFLGFALALVFTALVGEVLARRATLPRVSGYALAGLVLGPLVTGWFSAVELERYRGLVDLALALLLFELGLRLDLRWFRANPWLLVASAAEAALAFLLSLGALLAFGMDWSPALLLAAIALGTSPAVVMRVTAELRAEGQVTSRLLALCALNVAYSVILFTLLLNLSRGAAGAGWLQALWQPFYLVAGSLLVALLVAGAFTLLRRLFNPASEQGVVVIFGLLLGALAILAMLKLPPLLAPLLAGVLVKLRDPRPQLWARHFGSLGGVLVVALFMFSGAALYIGHFGTALLLSAAVVVARSLGKLGGVLACGRASGLSTAKSVALGLALLPLSGVALLLAYEAQLADPALGAQVLPVVACLVAVFGVLGPVVTQRALIHVQENRKGEEA